MTLGSKIRELRLEHSITQEQLAKQLSVSTQCVSKWENNITMPDIQLLPELSVYFGVTIDDLFDLTDGARLDRISNMLKRERFLDEAEYSRAESFLKRMAEEKDRQGKYLTLLAELYIHMADGYRAKAENTAEAALLLEPEKKYNHSLLRMAQLGTVLDYNYANHHKRIAYYQQFVKEHPAYERGLLCLLDELMEDNRLAEAEDLLSQLEKCGSIRTPVYRGLIQWRKGEQEKAQVTWEEMCRLHQDQWLVYALAADCLAKSGKFSEAIQRYRKSMELQPKPRYTDQPACIAHLYEIQGKYEEAIRAWEDVIAILREDYDVMEGESIDAPMREIERLKELCPQQ